MKHTKKLIPAIGMLLLSACMLVTSTFAWFAMNENVTATGMKVNAVGEQVYLQIVSGSVYESFQDGKDQTTATAPESNKEANLFPVNVVKNRVETEVEVEGQKVKQYLSCIPYDGVNNAGTREWVTNIGQSNSIGTAKTSYSTVDSSTANGKYFLQNTFALRLDPTAGAIESTKALNVASITTNDLPTHESADTNEDFKDCLNVLVVSTIKSTTDNSVLYTKGQVWECNDNEFTMVETITEGEQTYTISADSLTTGKFQANTYAVVDIYIFFNGDDPDCTQTKLAAAKNQGYTVEVKFTVA